VDPLYPSDIFAKHIASAPKYDDENLGSGFNGQFVGFAHRVLREGRLGEGL